MIYEESKEYGWIINQECFREKNPMEPNFGKVILRMTYSETKAGGLSLMLENDYDSFGDAEAEENTQELYDLLCSRVYQKKQEKR